MNQERAELLMNRAIDGAATHDEREQLAGAMRADPLLRSEFEEIQSVHASTESLFRQLSLPQDFSARVMRRVQGNDVPSDAGLDNVRLPEHRRAGLALVPSGNSHRWRVRVYAAIATISAAAALMLALGVITGFFTRAGIGTGEGVPTTEKAVADGRQGGPDTEEINRTVSSPHQPLRTQGETGEANPKDAAGPDNTVDRDKPAPKEDITPQLKPDDQVVKGSDNTTRREQPKPAPTVPDKGDEVVDSGHANKAGDKPENSEGAIGGVVDNEANKEANKEADKEANKEARKETTQAAEAPPRVLLGRLAGILSGRVEVSANGQDWARVSETQELFKGDQVRTQVNGTAFLTLNGGSIALDHRTQVGLTNDTTVQLYDGTIVLNREAGGNGDLDVVVEDYTLHLSSGCALIERKRRGLSVQKAVGFASLAHDEFGSVLLESDSGYSVEAEFGKAASEPKKGLVKLPAWSIEARSQLVMMSLDQALTNREFGVRERAYVTSRLPGGVEKLVQYPTTTESVAASLKDVISNPKLSGAAIIALVGEIQVAYADVTELTPDVINGHAGRAALEAENYDQWREYFWRLMRPPVQPKTSTTTTTETERATDKLKRVDNPPRKPIVKKLPPSNEETPEPDPEPDKN